MAVLSREEYFRRINERFGEDSSEETISFIEDMSDTYDDLERKAQGDGVDWKNKYEELDKTWRKRYAHRFFSGGRSNFEEVEETKETEEYNPDEISVEDLFKEDK